MPKPPAHSQGFTLLELSIVVIIIGLIAGSIIAGNSLVKQSRLMSIASDEKAYVNAVMAFRDKYNALPGDMLASVAQSYWGTNPNCGTYGAGTGTQTCGGVPGSGGGDGHIGTQTSAAMEGLYFWQHLVNAGLIAGKYNGASTNMSGGGWYQPGINCPVSKVSNATGFSVRFIGIISTDAPGGMNAWYMGNYGHAMLVGNQDTTTYADTYVPMVTPGEAYNFDLKFDDGKPGTGSILALNSNMDNCTTGTTHLIDKYNTSNNSINCQFIFITGF